MLFVEHFFDFAGSLSYYTQIPVALSQYFDVCLCNIQQPILNEDLKEGVPTLTLPIIEESYGNAIDLKAMIEGYCKFCSQRRNDFVFLGQGAFRMIGNSYDLPLSTSWIRGGTCFSAFLNKEYHNLDKKLRFLKDGAFDAVFTVHHNTTEFETVTGRPTTRIPFAVDTVEVGAFASRAPEDLPYETDIGYSGGSGGTSKLPWRVFYMNSLPSLRQRGIKATYFDFAPDRQIYLHRMVSSKMWLSTVSQGGLVPLRHWEVMATGRTLLICDRPTDERTYGVDIVEDEHAVMFSSEEEFMEKVAYYTENEAARARMPASDIRFCNRTYLVQTYLPGVVRIQRWEHGHGKCGRSPHIRLARSLADNWAAGRAEGY